MTLVVTTSARAPRPRQVWEGLLGGERTREAEAEKHEVSERNEEGSWESTGMI